MAQVKHLSMTDGLSSNYIFDITQDSNGFVWIATDNGLNCYDGEKFIVYNKQNSGLLANELNVVLADASADRVWVGTQRNGLCYYDESSYQIMPFPRQNELLSGDVTDISSSTKGGIWITHYHNGIDYYDIHKDTLVHFSFVDYPQIAGNHWTAIEDADNHLVIGHVNEGLSIIDLTSNVARNYRSENTVGLPSNEVLSLCVDKANRIWVGTSMGLALVGTNGEFVVLNNKALPISKDDRIFDISYNDDNSLRVVSESSGIWDIDLNTLDINNQSILKCSSSMDQARRNIRRVFDDSFGNRWICHYGNGADVNLHLKHPFADDIIPRESVWSLFRDDQNDGAILVSTHRDISVLKDGCLSRYPLTYFGITDNSIVRCFFRSVDGVLWLGTSNGGLYKYNHTTRKSTHVLSDYLDLDIHAISQSPRGNVILGTSKGIFICVNDSLMPIELFNEKLGDLSVQTIAFDAYGQLWVGTYGQGLYIFDQNGELLGKVNSANGLTSNAVSHIIPDSRGRIWVATRDGIVMMPDPKSPTVVRQIDENKKLSNSCIRAIIEDKSTGNIWMSTNGGISYLDVKSNVIKNYDCRDGIPLGFFNDASVCASKDGVLYFGSGDGLCYFRPQDVTTPRTWPDLMFHSASIDEETYNVNIHFAMPDISLSDVLEYEYKLVKHGLFSSNDDNNSGWQKLNSKEILLFGVSSGSYEVRIRSMWHDESWNGRYNSYSFVIPTPLYSTWYAWLFYVLALIFLIYHIAKISRRRANLIRDAEEATKKQLIFEQFVPKDLALKEEQEDFISHLTKIIESNLEKSELDVEFLAMQLNVSHSTLYRKVKGLTGLSITELVKKVRLHAAAKMLETSNMSVNEVADATGFSTPTYFRVNFKKEYGVSPSAYAKSKRI